MAFNVSSAYGKNTAKVAVDLSAAGGAVLTGIIASNTLAPVAGGYYRLFRIWGRVVGDWTLNKWNGTANTAIGHANAGGDNLDIPGLNFITGENESFRITGTDAASELYAEYAFVTNVTR